MASGDTLVVFTAAHNMPPATNFATLDTHNTTSPILVLDFDTTTQETAIFDGIMPRNYTAADTNVTVYITWACSIASGTVGWGVTFSRIGDGQLDIDTEGWATEQIITAATVPGTIGLTDITNVAITGGVTGTDSVAPGEHFRLRVRRNVSADNAADDAQLLSIEIKET